MGVRNDLDSSSIHKFSRVISLASACWFAADRQFASGEVIAQVTLSISDFPIGGQERPIGKWS